MLSLMMKDIYLLRKTIVLCMLYLVILIISLSGMEDAGAVFAVCIFALVHMFMMTSCYQDERNKSDIILNSMPLKRSVIVGSKYLMLFMYVVIASAFYLVASWILGQLNLLGKTSGLSVGGLILTLLVCSVSAGIYLPLYFKVGYMKSRLLSLIVFFAFFFILGFLVPGAEMGGTDSGSIDWPVSAPAERITALLLSLAVLAVSYLISLRIYRNKEF